MMARSKSSNQRPDTLMQDRNRQLDENLLQRAAGPYKRVMSVTLTVGRSLPVYLNKPTLSGSVIMSQTCQHRTHAAPQNASRFDDIVGPSNKRRHAALLSIRCSLSRLKPT
jgi:hypothetical protein